jgi:hypothetical protein
MIAPVSKTITLKRSVSDEGAIGNPVETQQNDDAGAHANHNG